MFHILSDAPHAEQVFHHNQPIASNLRWLARVLRVMMQLTVMVALVSFGMSIHNPNAPSLISTALFATLAALVMHISALRLENNQNWIEVCVLTLCSLYSTFLVFWVASGNLLSALLDH